MSRNRKRVSRNAAAAILSVFGLMGFDNNIDSRVDAMDDNIIRMFDEVLPKYIEKLVKESK